MTSSISVTKIRNSSGSSGSCSSGYTGVSSGRVASVTVRPVRNNHNFSSTPLATYLSLRSTQNNEDHDDVAPSIEIINNFNEDNNELPPGTKIITHPMNNAWSKKTNDFHSKRQSRTSEDLGINDIVRRLQQVLNIQIHITYEKIAEDLRLFCKPF